MNKDAPSLPHSPSARIVSERYEWIDGSRIRGSSPGRKHYVLCVDVVIPKSALQPRLDVIFGQHGVKLIDPDNLDVSPAPTQPDVMPEPLAPAKRRGRRSTATELVRLYMTEANPKPDMSDGEFRASLLTWLKANGQSAKDLPSLSVIGRTRRPR